MPSPKSPPAPRRRQATKAKAPPKVARGHKGAQINQLDAKGADWLCEQIIDGRSFRSIAADLGMNVSTLTRWAAANEDRNRQVREARIASARAFADEARAGIEAAKDPFELSRAKELAHHLRWEAARANPRDYGDKVQQEVSGPEGGPVEIAVRPRLSRDEWLAAHGVKLP